MDRSKVNAPKRLWLANALGNALLLAAAYWWLAIPERRIWQLGLSAVLGVAIVFAALWLYTATFRAFAVLGENPFSGALRRIPAVLVCVLAALVILLAIAWVERRFPAWANWTASALSYRLRRPIKPETVLRVLTAVTWVLAWIVVPVLALPRASAAAIEGFDGISIARPSRRFFFAFLLALLVGVWLPAWLIHWVPSLASFAAQALSFFLRFTLAWLLLVTAWLWVAWASTRELHRP